MEKIKISVIGLGLIGKERVQSINELIKQGYDLEIIGAYDPFIKNKEEFQKKFNLDINDNLNNILNAKPDWVFIATPHDDAAELAKKFLKAGVNVMVEKPLGRSYEEAKTIAAASQKPNQLWVGFNYRFFDGVSQAIKDIKQGKFGEIISINMILGHGCNPEITKGWKLDPQKAGGGCLIDPGIHFIDLCRIISNGKLEVICGKKWQGFWKTGIEEEVHLLMNFDNTIINFQISIVKWKSTFRFEINGTDAYGIIEGRNRNYGKQQYTIGPRWGWLKNESQAASEKMVLESPNNDVFTKEIKELLFPQPNSILKPCKMEEALENMRILEICRKKLN